MNVKHDTLNLSHIETDDLLNFLQSEIPLTNLVRDTLIFKLKLLQEDRKMPPYVDGCVDPNGFAKWLFWMLKNQT